MYNEHYSGSRSMHTNCKKDKTKEMKRGGCG